MKAGVTKVLKHMSLTQAPTARFEASRLIRLVHLSVAFVISFSFAAHAQASAPSPIEGDYQFQGVIRSTLLIQKERVYAASAKSAARLAELRTDGFHCARSAPRFFVCSKTSAPPALPVAIRSRAQRLAASLGAIRFEDQREPETLIFRGDIAEEWLVPQALHVGSHSYPSHTRLLSRGIEKVRAGTTAEGNGLELIYDPAQNEISVPFAIGIEKGLITEQYIGLSIHSRL